jgi:hypothetical protein
MNPVPAIAKENMRAGYFGETPMNQRVPRNGRNDAQPADGTNEVFGEGLQRQAHVLLQIPYQGDFRLCRGVTVDT